MTGTIRATANVILNQVGVEVGLDPVADPFSSSDASYRRLTYLINTAGEELSFLYPWDFLRDEHNVTTDGSTSYALPTDYLYLLNQTVWDRTNDNPVYGPLTPQQWAAALGQDSVSGTSYIHFRLTEDQIFFYPTDATGQTIYFEYIKRNWVEDSTNPGTYIDSCQTGADIPQFNRTLLSRMLKVKFLEATGFDTTKAQADLNQAFMAHTARNKSGAILNATNRARSTPFLGLGNVPDTGFGT